ncbi:hypothetical protein D3C85_1207510 [compost metagenome]
MANAQSKNKFRIADTTIAVLAEVKNDTLFIKTDIATFTKAWNKQKTPVKFKWIVFEYKEPEYFFKNTGGITLLNN